MLIDIKLTSIVSRLAKMIRLVVIFAVPIGYLVIGYNDFRRREFKAMIKATVLSSPIAQFPQDRYKMVQMLQEWTSFPPDAGRLHNGLQKRPLFQADFPAGKRFLPQRQ